MGVTRYSLADMLLLQAQGQFFFFLLCAVCIGREFFRKRQPVRAEYGGFVDRRLWH